MLTDDSSHQHRAVMAAHVLDRAQRAAHSNAAHRPTPLPEFGGDRRSASAAHRFGEPVAQLAARVRTAVVDLSRARHLAWVGPKLAVPGGRFPRAPEKVTARLTWSAVLSPTNPGVVFAHRRPFRLDREPAEFADAPPWVRPMFAAPRRVLHYSDDQANTLQSTRSGDRGAATRLGARASYSGMLPARSGHESVR